MRFAQETAYAKINLGLDVLGARPDGYHEVSMIMQSVGLADTVTITENKACSISISSNYPELSCGQDNLAYKAAALLAERYAVNPAICINLEKHIFLSAGLAGGSSDAAAVLRGLNSFWDLGLSYGKLEELAAFLGSDVPFCVRGGTALAEGRGEVLTALEDIPETIVVLAKPLNLEVSTAWVYKNYKNSASVERPCIKKLKAAVPEGLPALVSYMGNALESVTIPAYPIISDIKTAMLKAGADYALMSGSGPTVFALVKEEGKAKDILKALSAFSVQTAVTTTIGRRK